MTEKPPPQSALPTAPLKGSLIGAANDRPYEESRICGGSVCVCKIYRAANDRPYEESRICVRTVCVCKTYRAANDRPYEESAV